MRTCTLCRSYVEGDLVAGTHSTARHLAARGAGTRTVVEERLKEKGIVLRNVVDFGNMEGVKKAVEAGLGVSIQAQSVVQREISAGSLIGVSLAGMDAKLGRYYICRKDKHLSN